MDEYIKREEIRRAYEKLARSYMHGEPYIADWKFDEMIEELPAADVVPVRHGQWIMGTGENGLQTEHRKCSRCGEIVKYGYSFYGVHNFCNYCGAKMDGDDANG